MFPESHCPCLKDLVSLPEAASLLSMSTIFSASVLGLLACLSFPCLRASTGRLTIADASSFQARTLVSSHLITGNTLLQQMNGSHLRSLRFLFFSAFDGLLEVAAADACWAPQSSLLPSSAASGALSSSSLEDERKY